MKLVALAAVIAVCGAAKLDRTYLPPASAKSAGGSPGALQTPFAGNSFNNGLGGLPKGSYENDFQGVVVDAAVAGTRAAEEGVSGLGASRISYGSTDSKVGAAAFKTNPSAFRPETNDGQAAGSFDQGSVTGNANQGFSGQERPRAALDRAANILRYENEITPEGYQFAFETDNGISAEEAGVATNGVQTQGGYSYTADDGQVYSVSYTADENGYQPKGDHLPTPPPIPEEILKSLEQNARDEAAGLVDDGSYNAEKYNAGSDYSENGDTNGKFTHQSSNFGKPVADAAASGTFVNQNNQPFRKPSSQSRFGSQETTLAGQNEQTSTGFGGQGHSAHGGINGKLEGDTMTDFSGQYNQNSASKPGSSQKLGQSSFGSQGQTNAFGSSSSVSAIQGFGSGTAKGQNGHPRPSFNGFSAQGSGVSDHSSNGFSSGKFSQSEPNGVAQENRFGSFSSAQSVSSSQGLGNRNEYLPPVNQNGRPQSGRPQSYRPQTGKPQPSISSPVVSAEVMNNKDESSPDFLPLGQQDLQSESRPQAAATSFGQPLTSNGISSQNGLGVNNQKKPTNGRRPSINGNSAQGQSSPFSGPNEYLPPANRRPFNPPQISTDGTQYNQAGGNVPASSGFQSPQGRPSTSSFGSQSSFASTIQQSNGFNRPLTQRPGQNGNRFLAAQPQNQFGSSAQSNLGLNSQQATVEPDRELTTPLETSNSELSQPEAEPTSSGFITSSKSNDRLTKPNFSGQLNQNRFGSQSSSHSSSRPGQAEVSAFPTQPSFGQFNQNSQFENQQQSQNSFGQNNDAQYASSTQRPSYAQQLQGADDSYFYNQPSKPFSTSQGSRFPSAPSNQFNRITQQSSFSQNNQFSSPSGQLAGSTKYPRPPTVAPSSPSSQAQGQFSGQVQGSSKYPRPPTVAPTVPSTQIQFQGNVVNGVTQASASPFPSQTPTQATEGQFGSRPSFQQSSQFSQTSQTGSSFSQQPTRPSFGQSPQKPSNTIQSQSQSFTQQSLAQEQPDNNKPEQPVSSQQYNGEIYEYNKPAQSLPPPDSTPASSSIGSFEQKVQGQGQLTSQPRPQLSQTNDQDDQRPSSQFGGFRPQFGSQSQFGQNTQSNSDRHEETEKDSKPYGALAQSQNAAAAQGSNQQLGSRSQFGAPSFRPQASAKKPSSFGAQSQTFQKFEEQKPQFGAASSQNYEEQSLSSHGSQNQFGFMSACCKDGIKPQKLGFGSQFSQAFTGAQNRPQPTSSFAGMGEQFGGPRQPPSFDEETGYHY